MGRGSQTVGKFFSANACICKVLSIILLILASCLIIAGAVIVNKHPLDTDDDDYDEFFKSNSKYATGVGLLVVGIMVMVASIVTGCCAFQLSLCKNCLKSSQEAETEQQRITVNTNIPSQPVPPPPPPTQSHLVYPQPQGYHQDPVYPPPPPPHPVVPYPAPQPPYPAHPTAPPSYDEVVNAPTAPPPLPEDKK